ncbi:porin [Burkholderia stagnalis]|uniref:Porin n=1 Tax=Burkholderia stagnalis TaxID=1503054 RepID=A0ABX9YND7_9BURK|nr:porin [Burkholderia stagnalis]RQQ57328.1 porin [Burkholderia stagnalis]RQQ66854.1 porin [Burkholderia stagnalis]RQQ68511.1 porin [Burkholderia stagnalis]RQQ79064.1 porin [Burkholderia stagnalis]RQQ88311.1 porin [Burkholderia stagnalis]
MKSSTCPRAWGIFVAASLGAASGLAHAQSSVTLYGVVDAAVLYTNKSLNTHTGANGGHKFAMIDGAASASRFGLRGVEDLGGGMKATFVLESGIDVSNGGFANSNGNMFGRQAWLALSGNFGTVKAGLQYSPFVLAQIATDPRDIAYFGSGAVIYVDNVLVTGLFNQNAVSYTSPVIAGFQGSAMFGLGGKAGDFQSGRQYSASLKYQMGGLLVTAALYNGNAGGTAATPIPSTVPFTGRAIGAVYDFGNLTVKASYALYKVGGSFDNRVVGAGASYLITPAVNVDAGAWFTSDGNDTRNHSLLTAIGLRYFLSKATALYTQVGLVHNYGRMNTGLSINGALHEGRGTAVGAVLGMRHSF